MSNDFFIVEVLFCSGVWCNKFVSFCGCFFRWMVVFVGVKVVEVFVVFLI